MSMWSYLIYFTKRIIWLGAKLHEKTAIKFQPYSVLFMSTLRLFSWLSFTGFDFEKLKFFSKTFFFWRFSWEIFPERSFWCLQGRQRFFGLKSNCRSYCTLLVVNVDVLFLCWCFIMYGLFDALKAAGAVFGLQSYVLLHSSSSCSCCCCYFSVGVWLCGVFFML